MSTNFAFGSALKYNQGKMNFVKNITLKLFTRKVEVFHRLPPPGCFTTRYFSCTTVNSEKFRYNSSTNEARFRNIYKTRKVPSRRSGEGISEEELQKYRLHRATAADYSAFWDYLTMWILVSVILIAITANYYYVGERDNEKLLKLEEERESANAVKER